MIGRHGFSFSACRRGTAVRLLYTVLLCVSLPAVLARLLWRSRRDRRYRQRWAERFGRVGVSPSPGTVWLHAVSVGEVRAAEPVIRALRQNRPAIPLHITTVTPSGAELVRRLFGDTVTLSYLPYDLPGTVSRFLHRVQPVLALVMETELWPNLFHACHKRGIPLCLLNARLSDRSFRRYRRLPGLVRATLRKASLIAAQGEQDAQRFRELGAGAGTVHRAGNLKFEAAADLSRPEDRRLRSRQRFVWLAASTHAGEEQQVLDAFSQVADVLLVLVPRHPERAGRVRALCIGRGFSTALLSEGGDDDAQVLVGDTLGELPSLFAGADVAFLGGSLVPHGGHNPLEAAAAGVPVVTGPAVSNFEDIYRLMTEAGAARLIRDADELALSIRAWLDDEEARRRAGEAGRQVVERNRGALARTMALLEPFLPPR